MIIILSDCNNKERCKVLMVKILQDMINDANKKKSRGMSEWNRVQ